MLSIKVSLLREQSGKALTFRQKAQLWKEDDFLSLVQDFQEGEEVTCIMFPKDNLQKTVIECGISNPNGIYRVYESRAALQEGNCFFHIPAYVNPEGISLTEPELRLVGVLGTAQEIAELAKQVPFVTFVPYEDQNVEALVIYTDDCYLSRRAQLKGIPVLVPDYGPVTETVKNTQTGFHCHTQADFLYGIELAISRKFNREYIRERTLKKMNKEKYTKQYERVFRIVLDIIIPGRGGWYREASYIRS